LDDEELGLIETGGDSSRASSRQQRSSHEPHRIAFYLGDLAAAFHAFFNLGNDRSRPPRICYGARSCDSAAQGWPWRISGRVIVTAWR
jgi:hypothetical protein